MRSTVVTCVLAIALCAAPVFSGVALAGATITDFNNFVSDALYPSWALPASTVVSGPNSYDISATGYGSNYKYIGYPPILGAGNNELVLTVTLEGPPEADGLLGPIITLIDGDGTSNNYAWFGQLLGSHVLLKDINSPTWTDVVGTTPGLDLDTLTHMHMQLDPGGFGASGEYTVKWENLALRVPEPSSLMLLASCCGLIFGVRRR